jgi:hypothetical protein
MASVGGSNISSGGITLSDVCKLIELREKLNLHNAFRNVYMQSSFNDQSLFADYISHMLLLLKRKSPGATKTVLISVLPKLLIKKRYPELVDCFPNDIKTQIRKKITGTESHPVDEDNNNNNNNTKANNEDAFSMESSSSCDDDEDKDDVMSSSTASSCVATIRGGTGGGGQARMGSTNGSSDSESYAQLRADNDRLVKVLTEQKAMLLLLIEHATIDEGWKPFVKALVEKKM